VGHGVGFGPEGELAQIPCIVLPSSYRKLDFDKVKPVGANSAGQIGVLLSQALYAFLGPLVVAEDRFNSR
jgi:hypothetical protein